MDHLIEIIKGQLENQFLSGGLILVIFTGILAYLRNIPGYIYYWFSRTFITTIDVPDHDPAYFWIQTWLNSHEYTKNKARILTLDTKFSIHDTWQDSNRNIKYNPAPGYHILKYKNKNILLYKQRSSNQTVLGDLAYHESFMLKSFSKTLLMDLVEDARKLTFPEKEPGIYIYRNLNGDWKLLKKKEPRKAETLILDNNIFETLQNDINWFVDSKDFYTNTGVPYQRGYLLTGSPGNGKSSLIFILASSLNKNIYLLNLGSATGATLIALMSQMTKDSILVIEDIDAAFTKRADKDTDKKSESISFSDLLNALDGLAATEGRILFMTTNHPEKLDPALLRPGRSDKIIEITNANKDKAERLFLKFFPNKQELAEKFGHAIDKSSKIYSMAILQEHLLSNIDNAEKAANIEGHANGSSGNFQHSSDTSSSTGN